MTNEHRYFITGGFGLLGSQIANTSTGKVTILSRSRKQEHRMQRNDITVLEKQLRDITPEDIKEHDIIYHCASTVDNYNVLTDPYIDVDTNLNGTIALLEACKNLQKKPKIIYLSTFFVYGNEYEKTKQPITEDAKTDPLAIYPATKLCAESIIKLYHRLYDIPYLICRLTNVYGAFEDYTNKKKGALNYLIMQAIKGEELRIYKGGNFERDYIYTDDVIDALHFLEDKATNDLFLIGNGTPVLFKDIIDYLSENTARKSPIVEIDPPEFHKAVGITSFVADTSKINALGWKATIDYKEGLKRIIDRYKTLV